ncbi:2417_t:CDS:2 [Ambispora gerdemannii]|uniref:2417_t:CDS:1 n=1 Tax=Ambispora gerdemannii TaxID=144530 RepID=A0A9N9AD25_9GLOM|nr:2417_t:CDS:2 [Ambispora gerdemannii]
MVTVNPVRGEPDPQTEKDNNALFYGTGGTGKTSLVRRVAYNADLYPLIEIKGPALTPRNEDYKNGIDPLNKFVFTLCDIENTLEDDYGFIREGNSEVKYILFVDEADNVCTNNAFTEYTKLFDSKQLHNFTGKYEKPRKPTTDELIPQITEALDVRLKEMNEQLIRVNEEMVSQKQNFFETFNHNTNLIANILGEIAKKIE